jgi:hypothetical protein
VGDDSDIADGLAQNCVFLDLPESMAGRRGEVFLFPRLLRITNYAVWRWDSQAKG